MINKFFKYIFHGSWINHRSICLLSAILWVSSLYYYEYVDTELVKSKMPVSFLATYMLGAHGGVIYLIERYDEKWQLWVGYVTLVVFLLVPLVDPIARLIRSG